MSKARAGIVVFPGSNCDHDAYNVFKNILDTNTEFLWHKDGSIGDRNIIILPGGFSYGDYLRCGAIARQSNLMKEIVRFADNGGIVIGICNGFQVLCEAGLLPGVLMRNDNLKFICRTVTLKVENNKSIFTGEYRIKEEIRIPVAHGEGNYYCDDETLTGLIGNNQILFTYTDNPNGSLNNIAGIQNLKRNVLGMMPHPERASDEILGNTDGRRLFESVIESVL
ncbi:MAG: phosphoribosylformylglycinamidine synthase subunit PurQ [Ignavibacteria bacterium]|nr:phosphoribosylformylglycinamidine synthase subunit PurQ [Ignavibacteria bacterium]MBK7253948.1 phosphoribosylformylglycinamidine synthase subunit PurQ [Ignavibacteria bacterium]MBK7445406.1 phosphoribosylformylglycinamidine synthase subunit PurQ [Ignavibacteria bacterium]MBK9403973.1 phosphoribosylformylglycinamidine synthase subunit PurQ [Ignavibacteria bacterium]MBL0108423.1 phosphoribosylformylglycinamidine synthase subunit PurQ [Ignavibacteria bacterium]